MAVEKITEDEWSALQNAIQHHGQELAKLLDLGDFSEQATGQYEALQRAHSKLTEFFEALFAVADEELDSIEAPISA